MSQLKMYWFPGTPIQEYELPEGYSFSKYKHIADRDAWVEICKNGLVGDGLEGFKRFGDDVIGRVDIAIVFCSCCVKREQPTWITTLTESKSQ